MTVLEKLKLQIKIIQIQLQILFLRQKLTVPNLPPPTKIILHHGGGWLDFEGVNRHHKELWGFRSSLGFYVGYQYWIDRLGVISQARADNEEGAHTKGMNKLSIGVCLMGDGTKADFTIAQYNSLFILFNRLGQKYNILKSEFYGHKNFNPTICPSDRLYDWLLKYKSGDNS